MDTLLKKDRPVQGNTASSLCPLVGNPRQDCYCLNMNSGKILFALTFCGGSYEKCRIYQSAKKEHPPAVGADTENRT